MALVEIEIVNGVGIDLNRHKKNKKKSVLVLPDPSAGHS